MNNFYFTAGEFCAEGMGRNFIGYGAKFLIVYSDTYENAYKIAYNYATSVFGKQEYKDMWYGEHDWNWKVIPYTLYGFKRLYKNRLDLMCYHTTRASQMFTGDNPSKEKLNEVYNEFLKNHPILELTENEIKAFDGDINDMLETANKEVVDFSEPTIDINVNVEMSKEDEEFFN